MQQRKIRIRPSDERIAANTLDVRKWPVELVFGTCIPGRGTGSDCCPNDLHCRYVFSSNDLSTAVRELRLEIFRPKKRHRTALQELLTALKVESRIEFKLGGKRVCKTLYRLASGVQRQQFDDVVQCLLCDYNPPRMQRSTGSNVTVRETIAALDRIFADRSIKSDPSSGGFKFHIRTRWKTIYWMDYFALVPPERRVSYPYFVAVRAKYRRWYQKSPRRCALLLLLPIMQPSLLLC